MNNNSLVSSLKLTNRDTIVITEETLDVFSTNTAFYASLKRQHPDQNTPYSYQDKHKNPHAKTTKVQIN